MDTVRVSEKADDQDIQRKLDELYSKQELTEKRTEAMQHMRPAHVEEQHTVLAIAESSVQIDQRMRQQMMEYLREEHQYKDIIQKLEDPNQENEVKVSDRVFRIKQGILKLHETRQPESYSYW